MIKIIQQGPGHILNIFHGFPGSKDGFSCVLQKSGERVTVPRADATARIFVDAGSNVLIEPLQGDCQGT
jgi:hypothetical protein